MNRNQSVSFIGVIGERSTVNLCDTTRNSIEERVSQVSAILSTWKIQPCNGIRVGKERWHWRHDRQAMSLHVRDCPLIIIRIIIKLLINAVDIRDSPGGVVEDEGPRPKEDTMLIRDKA